MNGTRSGKPYLRIEALIDEFRRRARALHPEIDEIVVFGSAAHGSWLPGSDLDMLVFLREGHGSSEVIDLYPLLWSLDEKYGTRLSEAPALHPQLMIIDTDLKRAVVERILPDRGARMSALARIARPVTRMLKRIAPSYSTVLSLFMRGRLRPPIA